jgi:hypothetical protein
MKLIEDDSFLVVERIKDMESLLNIVMQVRIKVRCFNPSTWKLRQKDFKFEVSLGYIENLRPACVT